MKPALNAVVFFVIAGLFLAGCSAWGQPSEVTMVAVDLDLDRGNLYFTDSQVTLVRVDQQGVEYKIDTIVDGDNHVAKFIKPGKYYLIVTLVSKNEGNCSANGYSTLRLNTELGATASYVHLVTNSEKTFTVRENTLVKRTIKIKCE